MEKKEKMGYSVTSQRHCMVVHANYPMGETRVEREAKVLKAHGIEVDVICLQSRNVSSEEIVDGIHIYRMPVKRNKSKGTVSQLFEYITFFFLAMFKLILLQLRRRYDVIQVHNLPDWLVFVGLLPKRLGAKIILDLHDLMPEFYAARFDRNMNSWPVILLHWMERISCWFADQVITVTDGWRETLIERGVPASKISVVMNVADDRIFFCSMPIIISDNLNGRLKLLYHGNVTNRYGIDLAIRAVAQAREYIPGIHFRIHGWGDARQSLIELIIQMNLEQYVDLSQDGILTSELPELIRQADVCVVPYRSDVFTDGILPTKLMEYAALGMPVITARTPTIARYFDETMVEFFEPGNVDDLARCILYLYQNPNRMAELARGSRNFNQRYNWTKIGAEYVALVNRIGDKRGKSKLNMRENPRNIAN